MAPIGLTEVLSYSSEDSNHRAENLIKANNVCSWKCKPGISEKQSFVILQLEKLSQISAIDIGNDHSAFVEVLVGREGVDFQVLLVASSFMSPLESRSSTDTRRVRMFRKDKLNKVVMDQKWDRVKVICTQPFNKNVQYGLSFIRIVAGEQDGTSSTSDSSITRLGSFLLKEEEPKENDIAAGSFFAKRKEKDSPLMDGAAAIRAASNAAMVSSVSSPETNKRRLENLGNVQEEEFYQLKKAAKVSESPSHSEKDHTKKEKTDVVKTPKVDKKESHLKEREKERNEKDEEERKRRKKESKEKEMRESKENERKERKEKEKKESKEKVIKEESEKEKGREIATPKQKESNGRSKERIKRQSRPFSQLMKGVLFIMSGYQNPQRSKLRDQMLEMGAKYKNDWDGTCTHLICAFSNTPKYQAVKGKGKIVTAKWIEESHKRKIRLPWRRYNLEKNRNADESEEEIWATEILESKENGKKNSEESEKGNDVEERYDAETDADDGDTDDEVQRILEKKENNSPDKKEELAKNGTNSKEDKTSDDEYDCDTDVDDDDTTAAEDVKFSLPELQNYFKNSVFFVYNDMSESKRKEISRYIIAYDGKVYSYMNPKVNFVVTDVPWDENFDEALVSNPALQFVKSQWIWKCCDKERFIPPQPYLIMPQLEDSD